MENEFVSYEIALALKELGFDEPCVAHFTKDHPKSQSYIIINEDYSKSQNPNKMTGYGVCLAPLYQQAFRWFREKYNLFHEIQIDRTTEPKFCFDIFQYEHFGNYEEIRIGEWYLYRTQEEAELECLKKLIEIVKAKK